jgi:regulation of enolase protein 1 (concanavalin A-like superfamily)
VELTRDATRPEATGRVQVQLNHAGKNPRKILIQTAHRDASGRLVFEKPREIDLPNRPGMITTGGRLERIMKSMRKRSLAKIGSLVDPDEDCTLKKDDKDFKVTIGVPGKKVHTLSPEITAKKSTPLHNAPMALVDVEGDFAAVVKVTGDINPGSDLIRGPRNQQMPITFQGAGLVLYEDRDNFLRLERASGTAGGVTLVHRLLIEAVRDGKQAMAPYYIDLPENDLTLIITRRKGRIRCLFSPDERSILMTKEFAFDFPDKVKVGLCAANISRKPFDANFEDFVIIDDMTVIDEEFGTAGSETE